jgi:hypothetical protein
MVCLFHMPLSLLLLLAVAVALETTEGAEVLEAIGHQ